MSLGGLPRPLKILTCPPEKGPLKNEMKLHLPAINLWYSYVFRRDWVKKKGVLSSAIAGLRGASQTKVSLDRRPVGTRRVQKTMLKRTKRRVDWKPDRKSETFARNFRWVLNQK